MQSYKIYQVDSFTKQRFRGNPAGVVLNANTLSSEQMQSIARELNNSESAFIIESSSKDYDIEVRFFSPMQEVPLCSHATIAAHYVYAKEKCLKDTRILQKTKAGILPVDIKREGEDYLITMTQGAIEVQAPLDKKMQSKIIQALGLKEHELKRDYPIAISSTGHSKVMIPLEVHEILHTLKPDFNALSAISKEIACNGYYAFSVHANEEVLVHSRMFAPAVGVNEDPVTGNAAGALGAYLVHYDILQEYKMHDEGLQNRGFQNDRCLESHFCFEVVQGEAIKRAGKIKVSVQKEGKKPKLVQITGEAVIVFSGELWV